MKHLPLIIIFVVGLAIGYALPSGSNESDDMHKMGHETLKTHTHSGMDVSDAELAPEVTLTVIKDPKAGWNAKIETENFTFVPENASKSHVEGEGHAHLYVDGVKISRVYGSWHHFGENLKPGEHTVSVTLNTNNHMDLVLDDEMIHDNKTIVVE